MKSFFKTILSHDVFKKSPLVLVDVGASGGRWGTWREVADLGVVLEFDPDSRDFEMDAGSGGTEARRIRINKGVFPRSGTENLYLTKSPHCSSFLRPSEADASNWLFREFFKTIGTAPVEVLSLLQALQDNSLHGIDFIKLDTQGLDLAILRSIGDEMLRRIALIELEPGLAPMYQGEGRVHDVLKFMDQQPFWLAQMNVQGVLRSKRFGIADAGPFRKALQLASSKGAVWAGMTYLNSCSERPPDIRLLMTTWVGSMLTGHFGFALDLAAQGRDLGDPIFADAERETMRVVTRKAAWRLPIKAARFGWGAASRLFWNR